MKMTPERQAPLPAAIVQRRKRDRQGRLSLRFGGLSLCFIILLSGCAHQKVETSKTIYENARAAQAENNEVQAIADWKAVVEIATREIEHEKYLTSNYFLRASAYFELGEWEKGFEDLKNVQPESLSEQEYWIYPLYAVLMGDYYSQRNMT